MKIAYYMPFKPLGHPNPSGDLVLGTEIYEHLNQAGHDCRLISRLRCRWIYLQPIQLCKLLLERHRVLTQLRQNRPDIWLSYHCYYKAPDLLGPYCAGKLGIPYTIFQGIYSTKRRRQLKTRLGFYLNRRALTAASMVFTNKRRDELNLLRLLPEKRVCYIPPGIHTTNFTFSDSARQRLRETWKIEDEVVILAVAMLRPGVKTLGIKTLITGCGKLAEKGRKIKVIIVGDGRCREELQQLGRSILGNTIVFCGRIPRDELYTVYSGADIFAFPGIEESLGMVYLEAQSCGLPVIAYEDWGAREAVVHGQTGLLSAAASPEQFTENIDRLIEDRELSKELGRQAAKHVRANHELSSSYTYLSGMLRDAAEKR